MATVKVNYNDMQYDYLAYPLGSMGVMLLVKATITDAMAIGDDIEFEGSTSSESKTLYLNTGCGITESIPVEGSDPVTYTNRKYTTTKLASYSDDNVQVTNDRDQNYKISIKGETDDSFDHYAMVAIDLSQNAEAGAMGAYSPVMGWVAVYSANLKMYLGYKSFLTGAYGNTLSYFGEYLNNGGFVYGLSPFFENVKVFGQQVNPSESQFGVGQALVYPADVIASTWGRYGIHISGSESVCSKVFEGRDPIDVDPSKPDPPDPSGDDSKGSDPNENWSLPDGDYNYDNESTPDRKKFPADNPNSLGVMGLWNPTQAQLKQIFNFLWSKGFWSSVADVLRDSDPLECILALREYPFEIKASKEATMALGVVDTKISVDIAPSNYYAIVYDGTVIHPSNSFMDLSPYSNVQLYLPYVGIVALDIDAVYRKKVRVTYKIDIMNGVGDVSVQIIWADDKKQEQTSTLYDYPVSMGKELPVSATSYQRKAQSLAALGATALGTVAGLAFPAAYGLPTIMGHTLKGAEAVAAGSAVVGSATNYVNNGKAETKSSGSMNGDTGWLGINYPYFIYKMSHFSNKRIPEYVGRMSESVVNISSLKGSGYNEIEAVNLHIEGATQQELDEIKQTMLNGVIL